MARGKAIDARHGSPLSSGHNPLSNRFRRPGRKSKFQALAQCGGIQRLVLYALAAPIPVLRLYHIVPEANFLEPAVQMEPKDTAFITGHHFVREPLLLYHEQKQFVAGHFLHRLRRRGVDLSAYPEIFVMGVHPQFYDLVRWSGFG